MFHIDRFRATYSIPRGHPAPDLVKKQLDEIARDTVPDALASALSRALPDNDGSNHESIVLIRRLDADLTLDLAAPQQEVGKRWANHIVHSVLKAAATNDANDGVLRFDSYAAFLAHYLIDLADGSAANRWYYGRFAGLRMLSASAAIRTAVCDEPPNGLQALLLIPATRLTRVVAALAEGDARRILDRISIGAGDPDLAVLIAAWREQQSRLPLDAKHRNALRLYVDVVRSRRSLAGSATSLASSAVAALAQQLEQRTPDAARRLLDRIASGELAALYAEAPDAAEALRPLSGTKLELLASLQTPSTAARTAEPDREYTPFGGVFLLLRLLDDLPFRGSLDCALFRFWILLKCVGQPRAWGFFFDPVLRRQFGIDPDLSPATFAAWQRSISRAELRAFAEGALRSGEFRRDNGDALTEDDRRYLRSPKVFRGSPARERIVSTAAGLLLRNFAWRLPGFSRSSFAHLFANFLDLQAAVEQAPGRCLVRLSHPPLGLVLNLTGMSRTSFTCPWLEGRRFDLFPESD